MAILDLAPLAIWDASDLASLSQDSAGSTPVTAAGQPVGRWADVSGNGRHGFQSTSGNRPTYRIAPDGTPYLEFDGSNDALLTPGLDTLMDERNVWWAAFAVEQLSRTGIGAAAAVLGKYNTTSPRNSTHFWIGYDADGTWIQMERVVSGAFIGPYTTNFDALDLGDRDIAVGWYTGSAIGAQLGSGSPVSSADTRSVGSGNAIPMRIGGNVVTGMSLGFFAGIVFDRIPDAGEQAEIFDWLRSRLTAPTGESIEAAVGAAIATALPSSVAQTATVAARTASAHAAGMAAVISQTQRIEAAAAVAGAAGLPAVFMQTATVAAGAGAAHAAGRPATIYATQAVPAAAGRGIARGFSAAIAQAATVVAKVGQAVARGGQAAVITGRGISAWAGAAIARGMPAALAVRQSLAAGAGAAIARGRTAALGAGVVIAAGAGSAVAAGLPAQIGTAGVIECGVGVASAQASPASITSHRQINATAGRAIASGMLAIIGTDDPAAGPYSAAISAATRGADVDASTRGASISAAARRAQIRRVG